MYPIQLLQRWQIDPEKWDCCNLAASNGHVYAQVVFLDAMCPDWCGLVLGDYAAIMPLPQRVKWGRQYCYQPFLTPVLGIIGNGLTEDIIQAFLAAIPSKFCLWDLSFQRGIQLPKTYGTLIPRSNYVLPLANPYEVLFKAFHRNILQGIRLAERHHLRVVQDIAIQRVIDICAMQYPKVMKVEAGAFNSVEAFAAAAPQQVQTYGVVHPDGRLLASAAFLKFRNRAYYWLVGNPPEGRSYGASAFLLNAFITHHAGKAWVLDFEGSDQPGVAAFYRKFGAQPEPYHTLYHNRMPWPIKLLKKMPANYRHLYTFSQT